MQGGGYGGNHGHVIISMKHGFFEHEFSFGRTPERCPRGHGVQMSHCCAAAFARCNSGKKIHVCQND